MFTNVFEKKKENSKKGRKMEKYLTIYILSLYEILKHKNLLFKPALKFISFVEHNLIFQLKIL